ASATRSLEFDHFIKLAIDRNCLEKNIPAPVAGGRARETVRAANLQVVLEAEAQPPKVVGADSFEFPRRYLPVLALDVNKPHRVRIDLLEFGQDARQDEFLTDIELSGCGVVSTHRNGQRQNREQHRGCQENVLDHFLILSN